MKTIASSIVSLLFAAIPLLPTGGALLLAEEDRGEFSAAEADQVLQAMAQAGRSYQAEALRARGEPALAALLSQLFPEAVGERLTADDVQKLVEQLGDAAFERRELAMEELRSHGKAFRDLIQRATKHEDPEIQTRAAALLELWKEGEETAGTKDDNLEQAMTAYLSDIKDEASHTTLAKVSVAALGERVDLTSRTKLLEVCFTGLANSHSDQVHHLLLPLLKHEDPAVPMFAMKAISGRTGNNYVAPIHLGAIHSGRKELIKGGLSYMPGPVWDKRAIPIIRDVYVKIFDRDPDWDFSDDPKFMRLCAFVAARDFGLPKATEYLLEQMKGSDRKAALSAMQALGDSGYIGRRLDPKLAAALEPHLRSEHADLRSQAIRTLSVYQGEQAISEAMKLFQDPEKRVWQMAGDGLVQQVRYHKANDAVTAELRKLSTDSKSDEVRKRAAFLLDHLSKDDPSPFVDWSKLK